MRPHFTVVVYSIRFMCTFVVKNKAFLCCAQTGGRLGFNVFFDGNKFTFEIGRRLQSHGSRWTTTISTEAKVLYAVQCGIT